MKAVKKMPGNTRGRVFQIVAGTAVLATVIGEGVFWVTQGHLGHTILNSAIMCAVSTLTIAFIRKTGNLAISFAVFGSMHGFFFTKSLIADGGIRAGQYIYLPIFILMFGYFIGRGGGLVATAYAAVITTILAFREGQVGQVLPPPNLVMLYTNSISGLLFVGSFVFLSEKEKSYADAALEKTIATLEIDRAELKSLADSMHEGLVVQDHQGKIINFNPAALSILGLTSEQMTGRDSMDSQWKAVKFDGQPFPGEEHPAMVALATGKKVLNTLMGLELPSGEERWIRINAVPRESVLGRTVLTTFSDVTLELARERELSQAQATAKIGSFQSMLDGSGLKWSKQLYSIFEIDESFSGHALQQALFDRIHPEDRSKLSEYLVKAIQEGNGAEFNFRATLDHGKRIKQLHLIVKTNSDRDGNPTLVSGTCQDLTDFYKLQEENRFVLDALGIGVWSFNPNDQALVWDDSMYRLFDINKADFTGHYEAWEKTLTQEARERAVEELGLALSGQKEFDTVFEIQTPSKGKRWIAGRGKVIRDAQGAPVVMHGINYDVTQMVQAKNDLEIERMKAIRNSKLASLGEMSAGIAHEINNPLAIIAGTATLLQNSVGDQEKFGAKVNTILKSCDRISSIVRGLKKFSRSDTKSEYAVQSLVAIAREALVLVGVKATRRGVTIQFEGSKGADDCPIFGHETEIEQVFINLIANAIDAASETAEKWVRVELHSEQNHWELRVVDSGRGIAESVKAKLFEPFFTTKKLGEGTGLGLSISKGILDEHGATIAAGTHEGHTCFRVRFPKREKKLQAA